MPGSQGRGSLLALWQYAVDIGIYFYSFSEMILEMYLLFKVVEKLSFFFLPQNGNQAVGEVISLVSGFIVDGSTNKIVLQRNVMVP